jgi:predicted transcriptional regulator
MDNDHLGILITAVCLIFLLFVVPMSGLLNNRYVVTPATDADIAAANTDTSGADPVEVTFWELPPRVMLICAVLSISPLLLYPLEVLFLLKMVAYLGYRKITAASVLRNDTRFRIYETIRASPGIYFNEISQKTGIARSTLRYHLALLKMTGKITAFNVGPDVRYFENSGKFSETEQKVLTFLHNGRERLICEYLIRNPATTRGDLEKVLGISGAAVTWHTNRLRDAGILSVRKTGKAVRYAINPDAMQAFQKYLAQENGSGSGTEVPN